MALSSVDAAARQKRPIRTELEVAADVLMRLLHQGVLPMTSKVIAAISEATGVPVPALRDANDRAERRGYRPPIDAVAITAIPTKAPGGGTFKNEDTARSHEEGRARGQIAANAARSLQPAPDAETMKCSGCGETKPLDAFSRRADRPHLRWTNCDPCRAAAQANRYLSVQKRRALNAARLTFTIIEGDERADLACIDCGRRFNPGDDVYGDASLHHVACPGGAS